MFISALVTFSWPKNQSQKIALDLYSSQADEAWLVAPELSGNCLKPMLKPTLRKCLTFRWVNMVL